ncbi:hypothetical protein FPCIR_4768 [Fusarium pseudocircinatum]|uniref:Uncharacterized protein n=1 Tax=Fusarium pseudocircinatum TaxID=56676 RepID=A0A8H5URC7_9HYPO|nr:hypothetical protein FPCIR_4768 [Fusarium pseudocircinatum]
MSSSRSSSPGAEMLNAIPNSHAYTPEMDRQCNQKYLKFQAEHRAFRLSEFDDMEEFVSSLDSEKTHIMRLRVPFPYIQQCLEVRELCQSLNFVPWLLATYDTFVLRGLGRRLHSSYYDIWFTLPLVSLGENLTFYHPEQDTSALLIDSDTGSKLYGEMGLFYLSINLETMQMRLLFTEAVPVSEKLVTFCKRASEYGSRDDPFALLTCALSSILEEQAENAYFLFSSITEMEDYSNSLQFEITEDEETKISEVVDCTMQAIEDTLSEHKQCRKLISIHGEHFRRVEKNLQTLRSRAISFKTYQETRIRRINVSLSTLSSLLSLRADSAIKASTEAMTRLTEANREDSGRMNEIAIATKLDSEAMITIAKLTMFYLPSTFVATLFSMGIFNFDFDNGKNGRLVMSSQWWMYIIFAIPLTLGTFYWFRAVTRSHKQASQKAEREAKQLE